MRKRSRRRDVLSFFANPFVVLADVMVSLVFIISLFLLSTTVYSEQMELIVQRDARRKAMASSLSVRLQGAGLLRDARTQGTEQKYRLGNVLEVEDDGTIQRFRFLSGLLDFEPGSTNFKNSDQAQEVIREFGAVLVQNRARIKSIVIEGHASADEGAVWPLSQARAEKIRAYWARAKITEDITEDFASPVYKFLSTHTQDGSKSSRKLWDPQRFHEWHLQEYQARRRPSNEGRGVIPSAWVIASGRGDQVRRQPVAEFKVEYTERDAPPLDDYIAQLSPALRRSAQEAGLR